jgi:hypothetical protein
MLLWCFFDGVVQEVVVGDEVTGLSVMLYRLVMNASQPRRNARSSA